MREIILDIETTGLEHKEGHRVIEIGCIELNSKEVGASYHQYINPSKTLTEDNICLLYTSPSPRDEQSSRMPSSA